MSHRQFTDTDGDTYTVSLSASRHNVTLTYHSPEGGAGTDLFIFKVEDADRIAAMILDAAQEAGK
jgi:hypothetical protein